MPLIPDLQADLSSRPVGSTEQVPEPPGLHRELLFQKKNLLTKERDRLFQLGWLARDGELFPIPQPWGNSYTLPCLAFMQAPGTELGSLCLGSRCFSNSELLWLQQPFSYWFPKQLWKVSSCTLVQQPNSPLIRYQDFLNYTNFKITKIQTLINLILYWQFKGKRI